MGRARGSRGTGTVVERGGKWYVRRSVTLPNGKRSRPLGRPYPTKAAAERARESHDVAIGSAPWTWDAIFDQLLDELTTTLLENEQEAYFDTIERHIRLHLRPRLGKQVARETKPEDLERLWRDLLAAPHAAKYVTTIRGTLSLATAAALHEDAHLVKYTLACIHSPADDPAFAPLYLSAADHLVRWWRAADAAG